MTPVQQEALDALEREGNEVRAAASLGIPRSTFRNRLHAARINSVDPAIAGGMKAIGTGLVPSVAWIKTKPTDDAPGVSFMLRPPVEDPIEIAQRMREAFEGMEPAQPVTPPDQVLADLCAVVPLMDVHLGMLAWGRETGAEDYDVKLAAQDMRQAFGKVLALTPRAARGVLIIGGDFFHADDNRAETPANRHKLDVDGRFFRVLEAGVAIIGETIERMLAHFGEVVVRVLRGNHDPHSCLTLTFALAERYRLDARITIDKDPRDLWMMQWGRSAVFAHHGDRGKPQQMALYLSDVCPFWSATRHRHYLTGHVHHDAAKDFGPLRWESLRAFCPPDSYAAGMGYGARRALQVLTFDKTDGLVLRALDPIERAAA